MLTLVLWVAIEGFKHTEQREHRGETGKARMARTDICNRQSTAGNQDVGFQRKTGFLAAAVSSSRDTRVE